MCGQHTSGRVPWAADTFPQLQALRGNGRPDDQVVGFEERVGELAQLTGPIDPRPQRHCLLLQLQLASD